MLLRLLIALFLVLFYAINIFASEICLPDYMIGQVTYKLSSCENNIVIHRDSEYFSPRSGQCLMYNDVVSVKGNCVARIITNIKSYYIGSNYNVDTWKAPQKKIVHSALHDDFDFVRIVAKLFEAQTISKRAVSQGMNDECLDQNSNSAALAPLLNFPPGIQKIGDDIRELTVVWKGNTGVGFVEVSLKRGSSDAPGFASRVCWKSWTTISLPNDLKPGEQLVLKAVDAYDTKLQWQIEVCAAGELPSTPAAPNNDEMVGLWRLFKAPPEYRLDALSRINRNTSELVAPRGILNAVLADIPLTGSK